MFTDMVGYATLAQADEARALAVLAEHNRLLRSMFPKFHGREVKTVGDAFLVEFGNALDAARCALEIQRILHDPHTKSTERSQIRVRIGLHVGDVVQAEGDLLGDAVNIASRIEPLAEPGGICLTQQMYDQVQNKLSTPLEKLPPVVLKHIRLPMNIYRAIQPWDSPEQETPPVERMNPREIAVLPLVNISPDPNDGYFADGLTEELISVLSEVRGLGVIARTSVAPYKFASKSVAQIGAELGVGTVLEGSVRKSGKKIRITLQLVDVTSQRHIWSESYDREIDDVFKVQSDVAARTAEALRLRLVRPKQARPSRQSTANVAAYDLYLRGLAASSHPEGPQVEEGARCFESATKLDPAFAEAYGAWANLYVTIAGDSAPMSTVMPRARELAAKALALDPDSSDAHLAMGNIAFQSDLDWERAETEFKRALELNPNNIRVLQFYSLLLLALGRYEEAKELTRQSIRLDPAGRHRSMMAWLELLSGNVDAALDYAERERDNDPSDVQNHNFVGFFSLAVGRREEARAEADAPLTGADEEGRFDHALLNALVGRPAEAWEVIRTTERGEWPGYNSGTHLAMLYAALGEKAKALDLLEKDFREGETLLWMFYRGVWFDPIRDDPRFIALLRQYGLPLQPARRAPAPAPKRARKRAALPMSRILDRPKHHR